MPLFLIPFVFLAARNTKDHKTQAEAALMQAQTDRMRYELQLKEYEERHPKNIHKVDPHRTMATTHKDNAQ